MRKLIALLFLAVTSVAQSAPDILEELPAEKYCPNAPSTGGWNEEPGHCRFALEGQNEEVAVVRINGSIVRAKRTIQEKHEKKDKKLSAVGDIVISRFQSEDGTLTLTLTARITEDTCWNADENCCGITSEGILEVSSPQGTQKLTLSRYDGA